MKKHVTSLDLSKRMKEAGVKQRSEYSWSVPKSKDAKEYTKIDLFPSSSQWGKEFTKVPAFLATEILGMLPENIIDNGKTYWLEIIVLKREWRVQYRDMQTSELFRHAPAPTLQDAAGEMYLWLISEGIIKPS